MAKFNIFFWNWLFTFGELFQHIIQSALSSLECGGSWALWVCLSWPVSESHAGSKYQHVWLKSAGDEEVFDVKTQFWPEVHVQVVQDNEFIKGKIKMFKGQNPDHIGSEQQQQHNIPLTNKNKLGQSDICSIYAWKWKTMACWWLALFNVSGNGDKVNQHCDESTCQCRSSFSQGCVELYQFNRQPLVLKIHFQCKCCGPSGMHTLLSQRGRWRRGLDVCGCYQSGMNLNMSPTALCVEPKGFV